MKKNKVMRLSLLFVGISAIVFSILLLLNKDFIDFSYQDNATIELEYGQKFNPKVVKAYYKGTIFNQKGTEIDLTCSGKVDESKLGDNKVIFKAEHKDKKGQITVDIKVVDTTAPSIELVEDENHYTDYGANYEEEGFSAFDIYDGDLTDKVTTQEKDGQVIYEVTDSNGNKAVVTREIRYKDMSAPVITLNGSFAVVKPGETYQEAGYTAIDNHDGNLTDKVIINSNVNDQKGGIYSIEYSCTDEAGNTSSVTRKVYVFSKEKNGSVIYLTFDDGPSEHTKRLLDILDKYDVKVTFFVTNLYPSCQYLIGEEYKRGHTVAVHTYSHSYGYIYSSEYNFYEDQNRMRDIIYQQTGTRPTMFRFPGGSSNTVSAYYCQGIMTSLANSSAQKGYRYCDWNVSSGDASGYDIGSSGVFENVTNGCIYENNYVLQHDSKGFSVDAVEEIILWGLSNGYSFKAISDDTRMYHHYIAN